MEHHVRRAVAIAIALVAAALAPGVASATPDARLLAEYQPVTRFDPQERFLPTSMQSFLEDADLERFVGGSWTLVNPEPGPGNLPDAGAGWRLNQDSCTSAAPLGGLACYAAAWEDEPGAPVVYGRVARLEDEDRIVLQYWYFYYDNVYSYVYPPANVIWQAHEGDWENVNVVLDEEGQPIQAGYSRHCTGEVRAWADTPRWNGTHPIVHVAAGSHAAFFEPGVHPIAPRCLPPGALALLQQAGLPPPVDYAFPGGDVAGPPGSGGHVSPIRKLREQTPWLDFPGFWGEREYFFAPPPIGPGLVPFGNGPVGPAQHASWTDPLGTLATWE
jgi:hypothetical protein